MCLTTLDLTETTTPKKPPVSGAARKSNEVTDTILKALSARVATETGVAPEGDPSAFDLVDAQAGEDAFPSR